MKILVANLGSTSFKYRLFDMQDESLLARGGVERIGADISRAFVEIEAQRTELSIEAKNHAVAVQLCLQQLTDKGCLKNTSDLAAIGFKAVHAKDVTGVQRVDERVLAAMESYNEVAPAHNPPYVAAMRLLASELPNIPLVAAFETGFHQTIPPAYRSYAIPEEWSKAGIIRHGFHGASHRYIATRTANILKNPNLRIISCHLGGSSSLCAIKNGQSIACSLGMSPQSGLPHNNRIGDFDIFALPEIIKITGLDLKSILEILANKSGMLGLSGFNDLRDIEAAANRGEEKSRLALDVFVASVRHYLGAYLVQLGGADVIVFTGGIGENSPLIRECICKDLSFIGIDLDYQKNSQVSGESPLHSETSTVQLWTIPTNEEIIVARQTLDLLQRRQ